MDKTKNYQLNKPAQTDFYNVDDFNENIDVIETALLSHHNEINGIQDLIPDNASGINSLITNEQLNNALAGFSSGFFKYKEMETYIVVAKDDLPSNANNDDTALYLSEDLTKVYKSTYTNGTWSVGVDQLAEAGWLWTEASTQNGYYFMPLQDWNLLDLKPLASAISNDSSVEGATVKDALESLKGKLSNVIFDVTNIKQSLNIVESEIGGIKDDISNVQSDIDEIQELIPAHSRFIEKEYVFNIAGVTTTSDNLMLAEYDFPSFDLVGLPWCAEVKGLPLNFVSGSGTINLDISDGTNKILSMIAGTRRSSSNAGNYYGFFDYGSVTNIFSEKNSTKVDIKNESGNASPSSSTTIIGAYMPTKIRLYASGALSNIDFFFKIKFMFFNV